MGPDDVLLIVMLTALTLYAILGGADFGAGIWEFTTAMQATDRERQHIYKAIGPVWEANHVWLIFVLVILMNGFPAAFAALSRALWLPLLLALCGILFRGSAYIFRSYGTGSGRERVFWESVFAIASTATPLFLGSAAGAVASGKLMIPTDTTSAVDFVVGWISALTVFTGFYSVALCAYLSAVFLLREARQIGDEPLTTLWRQRALSTGLWVGVLSFGGLVMVAIEAPALAQGFLNRGWPLVIASLLCGIGSLVEVWRLNCTRAAIAAGGAVTAVIWGWGISQYPAIIPPAITASSAKAPDNVLWMMLGVISLGAVFLLPALAYLLVLFKREQRLDA
ncbi:MAG: cytochrome d ubiquinol oxidase subunit II [Planctomycetes bacterium]|nr:cytochrome d ubiquinol oxidase subunit II [Planctomycetota bacterium]